MPLVLLALPVLPVLPVRQDLRVPLARRVRLDLQVRWGLLGQPGQPVLLVLPVSPALPAPRVLAELRDPPVPPAQRVRLVPRVLPELLALMVLRGQLDLQGSLVLLDLLVLPVRLLRLPDLPALPDLRGQRVRPVPLLPRLVQPALREQLVLLVPRVLLDLPDRRGLMVVTALQALQGQQEPPDYKA